MSKKFSDDFSHQNLESKKPAGCLSGIFQLFDNQKISRRELDGQGHKIKMGFSEHVPSSPKNQRAGKSKVGNQEKSQENPRSSLESSRNYFSLSSSSFCSHEHKPSQEEPTNPDQSFSSRESPKNSPRAKNSEINQPHKFIDIIKESLHKDFQSVSVKKRANELVKRNKVLKPVDSPRPMDLSKLKVLNESLKIPTCSSYKGYPAQLSYDGREVLQAFTDAKQSNKEREFPRLSMGSHEESLRCDLNFKVNSIFKDLEKKSKQISAASNHLEDQESNENHPSIVAKIMGLEPIDLTKHKIIRIYDSSNSQRNLKIDQEGQRKKPSQSKGDSLKFPRNSELDLESTFNIRFSSESMSAYSATEKRLQKLQEQHSGNLKESILKTKKDGNWKQNSENTINLRQSKIKTKKDSISERALKSASIDMEPESKSGLPPTPVAKLEVRSHLRKNHMSWSAYRIKDVKTARTDGDQKPTGNKANSRRPQHVPKKPSERLLNKCKSQILELRKPDLNKKPYAAISSKESNNFKKQSIDMQSSESVSPKQNPSNTQDNEHQNPSKQFSVDTLIFNSSIKGKAHLFQQSNQSSGKAINNVASEHKKHATELKEDQSTGDLEKVFAPQSSLNSVLDALVHCDDLPLSLVSFSNKEDQNLHSDHRLKMVRLPLTLPTTSSSEIDSDKTKSIDNINQKIRVSRTTDEPNGTAITLETQNPEGRYVAEILQLAFCMKTQACLPYLSI